MEIIYVKNSKKILKDIGEYIIRPEKILDYLDIDD